MVESKNNRLGIYFFYDQEGIADEYIFLFLNSLKKHFSKILIVSNGKLKSYSLTRFENEIGAEVLVRDNSGFDVWAYKEAIEFLGWELIRNFQELVLLNFTIVGPVNSFDDMFQEMSQRDLDFWGITVHNGADWDPFGFMPDGVLPIHLQSHFIAVRNNVLVSDEFKKYWENIPPINSYEEAVGKHEAVFTKHFSDLGYKWESYVDTSDFIDHSYYPLFSYPIELIRDRNCPVFKRKTFIAGIEAFISDSDHSVANGLYTYLKESNKYDFDLFWPHLSRTVEPDLLTETLSLYEAIDDKESIQIENYSLSIIAIASDIEIAQIIESHFSKLSQFSKLILVFSGRNLTPDSGDFPILEFDWIQKPDWQTSDTLKGLEGTDFSLILDFTKDSGSFPFSNRKSKVISVLNDLCKSDNHISQILNKFKTEKHLGLMFPPPALHGEYMRNDRKKMYKSSSPNLQKGLDDGAFWLRNHESITQYFKNQHIQVSKKQSNYYFLMQLAKKYYFHYSFVISSANVPHRLSVLENFAVKITEKTNDNFDFSYNLEHLTKKIEHISNENEYFKKRTEFQLGSIYFDQGNGYIHDKRLLVKYRYQNRSLSKLKIRFRVPSNCVRIRFDPIEESFCFVKNISINKKNITILPLNASKSHDSLDLFLNNDPQYELSGDFESVNGKFIEISFENYGLAPLFTPQLDEIMQHIQAFEQESIQLRTLKSKISLIKKNFWGRIAISFLDKSFNLGNRLLSRSSKVYF